MQPGRKATEPIDDGTIAGEIKKIVGKRNFEHWFANKTILTATDDVLTVGVSSPFLLGWMQKQFRGAVTAAAQRLLGKSARVEFQVDSRVSLSNDGGKMDSADERKPNHDALPAADAPTCSTAVEKSPRTPGRRRFQSLHDFVTGTCNELALTAARQVCHLPGGRWNPLFIHGGVGTGKTHLLEGIYSEIRASCPSLQIAYLTSEAFTNYFTHALRNKTLPSFRQRFRSIDVLLVDDIDFLDSKKAIQEEFLHTFEQLVSHDRQIVLASDRHPKLLTKLSDELVTRFLSGLVCRIDAPDLETRTEIVKKLATRRQANITSNALAYVARRFSRNVRELEGAMNCLETYHQMTGRRIGVTAARQILSDLERDCVKVVSIADIERAVCHTFGLPAGELRSSKRSRSISQPRMLAMFLARRHTQAAYSEIGQYFGGRNHSTVMSAENRVKSWIGEKRAIQVAADPWPLHDLLDTIEQQMVAG